ncbi:MAG: DUF5611 family protein [Thermoplasmatales archaeon]
MRKYPCKREISEELVQEKMKEIFGNVMRDGESYVSSLSTLTVRASVTGSKELTVETKTSPSPDQEMLVKLYNRFVEEVTGYSAKERKKMVSKI